MSYRLNRMRGFGLIRIPRSAVHGAPTLSLCSIAMKNLFCCVLLACALTACGGSDDDAPVSDLPITQPGDPATPPTGEETPAEPEAPVEVPKTYSSFVLPVLPDTQFYSRYNRNIFLSQTQWIADHATQLQVPMVLHLGDIVDQAGQNAEWVGADAALKVLEDARISYSILPGNHDTSNWNQWDDQRTPGNEPYLTWFPRSRQASSATFGGMDSTGYNTWHTFTAQGQKFLVLALGWKPSAQTRAWANQVLADNPTLPAILTTHQLITIQDGNAIDPADDAGSGAALWNDVIAPNPQVFLTINGHYHGAAHRVQQNNAGLDVIQVLADYQMDTDGGNGYLRLMEFDLARNTIETYTFSSWLRSKPEAERSYIDELELADAPDSFTVNMDFKARFSGFNPDFAVPETAGNASFIADAKTFVDAANYVMPADPRKPAADDDDYVKVPETSAHWRFVRPSGVAAGDPVQPDAAGEIPDASGKGNPLQRQIVPTTNGITNDARLEQMVWSDSHHPFSAAKGSICMVGTREINGQPRIVNFLQTLAGAPVNDETFVSGYTVEAIVRVDDFTEAQHRWAKILAQTSRRNQVPGWRHNSEPDSSSAILGISSLKEAQWEVVPTNTADVNQAHFTNWSHELPGGTWQHIAIVNDGLNTDMYVEGVKVLRNASGGIGMGVRAGGAPWRVGAGTSGGTLHYGFNGCVNEIRMVPKVLPPEQWLTARPQP